MKRSPTNTIESCRATEARAGMPFEVPAGLALLAALAWPMGTLAQSPFKPVEGHRYTEVIDPKLKVSSHLVVGLSLAQRAHCDKIDILLPSIPRPGSRLRVELDSPSGQFHGEGLFDVEPSDSGWTALNLAEVRDGSSKLPADLAVEELSISARLLAGRSERQLLARRSVECAGAGDPKRLRLHVNSRRSPQVMVRGASDHPAVKCNPVTSRSVKRFDTICEIDRDRLGPATGGALRLTLLRQDGFAMEPTELELPGAW